MLRDRLKALTFIQGSQAINAQGIGDADIFALAHRNGVMGIQAFFIRGGQNWGHRSFFPSHVSEMTEDEVFTSFLAQFYEDVPPARLILLDRELTEGDCWRRHCPNVPSARLKSACPSAATVCAWWQTGHAQRRRGA